MSMKTKICQLCEVVPTKHNRLAYIVCYSAGGAGYEPANICKSCRDKYKFIGREGITSDIEKIRAIKSKHSAA